MCTGRYHIFPLCLVTWYHRCIIQVSPPSRSLEGPGASPSVTERVPVEDRGLRLLGAAGVPAAMCAVWNGLDSALGSSMDAARVLGALF